MIERVIGKSPEAIQLAITHAQSDPEAILGPWLMGFAGLTFMLGILVIQTWQYFSTFGYESLGIFTLVTTSVVLSVAQWLIVEIAAWEWFVAQYGNWSVVVGVPWPVWFQPIIAQVTVFVAQIFFAYRCFILYRRNKVLLAGLILAMLTSVAMFTMVGLALKTDPFNYQRHRKFRIPALCINLSTDLVITSLTLWKLSGRRGGNVSSPKNGHALKRLRNLTIEAAIPPAICASLNMAFFLALGRKNIIFTWFNIMTPRFYVSSLMFTLNTRVRIRQKFNFPGGDDESYVDATFEFCNVAITGPYAKSQHTDTRRTAVAFGPMGQSYAPSATIGIVDERAGDGNSCDDELERRFSKAELSVAGTNRSDLRIDLDRWESSPTRPSSATTSIRQRRSSAPPTPSSRLHSGSWS